MLTHDDASLQGEETEMDNQGKETRVERWQGLWDHFVDVPWGVFGFVALLLLLITGGLDAGEVAALGTASGLIAVGHGIHTGARHLARNGIGGHAQASTSAGRLHTQGIHEDVGEKSG
jgi:hypothetical protein